MIEFVPVVIGSGESLSASADLGGKVIVGVCIPTDWTTANLRFRASRDNSTFLDVSPVIDISNFANPAYIALSSAEQALAQSIRYVKLLSILSGTPVNQSAERTIHLVVRPLGCSITVTC